MMRKGYVFMTVVLVLIIILGMKGTVMSKEVNNRARAKQNHYYEVLEEAYREKTQALLEREGYRNCGINLTWVAYEDGSREYTLLLHHRKLERMSPEERSMLQSSLRETEFQNETCSFRYELGGAVLHEQL